MFEVDEPLMFPLAVMCERVEINPLELTLPVNRLVVPSSNL